ncbi:hypothetical protein T4B_2474 [Trichinella pseudospiralis]|uniref:Uncharacterized protein n=1 Tax=Trichinella pseudospiralis TaxID=6337 RepID=A0A0V1IHU9_TRIPS|nr:hypothetical protein T4B_2474 [Trichinella pseudospiralis]KRZ29085.1 hypothetical protein T4C_10274 [Trichinella pseudospiralis]
MAQCCLFNRRFLMSHVYISFSGQASIGFAVLLQHCSAAAGIESGNRSERLLYNKASAKWESIKKCPNGKLYMLGKLREFER